MTNHTSPGITCDCGTGTNLALPGTVTDNLAGAHLRRVNLLLLEYARDAALLQSRAYDAVLKIIGAPNED